jgi:hypothetical protein
MLAGYPDPPGLLARMKAAGVNRVVLLSTGAVVGGDLDNYVVRFNVVSEAAVRDCGLTWTVLRPSGFMSNALRWRPQLKAGNTIREPFADVPVALIDPFDIGAAAARALTEDGHDGRSYRLTGNLPGRPGRRDGARPARPPAPDLSRLGAGPQRRLRLSPGYRCDRRGEAVTAPAGFPARRRGPRRGHPPGRRCPRQTLRPQAARR